LLVCLLVGWMDDDNDDVISLMIRQEAILILFE